MKTKRRISDLAPAAAALALALILLVLAAPSSLQATPGSAVQVSYDTNNTQAPAAASTAAAAAYGSASADKQVYSGSAPAVVASQPVIARETTKPVITNLSPADGSITGPTVNFSADYSDPEPSSGLKLSTAMLHVDNRHQFGSVITGTGISCLKAGLTNGSHMIEAFICDNDMNCSVARWYVTVDAIAPAISNTQPTGVVNSQATSITADFSDGSGAGVDAASASVNIDGSPVSGCAISAHGISCPVSGLADGDHSVQVDVSDLVGNHASGNWNFSVDTAAIGVSGQVPAGSSWQNTASPSIGVHFQPVGTNAIDASSVTVLIDGVDVSASADRQEDGMSYLPLAPRLSEGWHDVSVTVHDGAGHSGHDEWSFAVDTIAPLIEGMAPQGPASTSRPAISATFSDSGSGIDQVATDLTIDGADRTAAATLSGTGITFVPAENLAAGSHNVQLTLQDLAGNQQTSAWSFTVPRPAAAPQTDPPARQMTMYEYWQSTGSLAGMGMGSWIISGFQAFPNMYYLPWYDSGPGSGGLKDQIVIHNQGAGEAFVNVIVGGSDKWQGKVPEGGTEICEMPGTTGGPVKIVCPTGQPLEVTRRLSGESGASEAAAVPEDALEPAVQLPWYEARPGGSGSSTLVIANVGDQEAAVDVYIGDPAAPESLRGHYSIGTGSAVRTQLPDASGGPVLVVSGNNQPLIAGLDISFGGSAAEIMATGISRLGDRYEVAPAQGGVTGLAARLLVGNGNDEDRRIQVSAGGRILYDPANPENDFFTIPRRSAQAIDTSGSPGEALEIVCTDCNLGEGISVGSMSIRGGSVTFPAVSVPESGNQTNSLLQ